MGMTIRGCRGKTDRSREQGNGRAGQSPTKASTPKASTPTTGRTTICASSSRGPSAPARSRASRAPTGSSRWARSPRSSTTRGRSRRRSCSRTCRATRKGMRLLSGATNSSKRLAITLGLPVPNNPLDVVRAYRDRMKTHQPIPPKTVAKGAGARERRPRRQGRPLEVPGAVPARARRRPLHRHRRSRDHARPGGELGQRRHLPRHGAGQEPRLAVDLARQARPPDPREIFPRRQALPGADLLRPRSAALPRRRQRAQIRALRIRLCGRPPRRALRDRARASSTGCRCRRMPRSCSKAR